MALATDLTALGMPANEAGALGLTRATVTATGTTAGTATIIPAQVTFANVTAAASQTGVRLSSSAPLGTPIYIVNVSGTDAVIYPPSGTLSGGTSVALPTGLTAVVMRYSATLAAAIVSEAGGSSYHADAVVFDGAQWLNIDALTTPADNGSVSWAGWFWIPPDSPPDHFFYRVVWVADPLTPDTGYQNWMTMELSLEHPLTNTQQWDLGVDNYSKVFIGTDGDTGVFTLNSWHHVLFSAETNFGVGSKRAALYIDDELNILVTGDDATAFIMAYSGLPFWAFNDGVNDQYKGYASDVWIAPNVSLLNGGNSIPEATRRLFISAGGKPVDPSGFPSSAILFSGNASTFPINQGTGGVFTLTGILTNASTSPSD